MLQQLKGVLRYENLRESLFDPDLGALVRAEDLAVPAFHVLYVDDTAEQAWQHFRHNSNIDSMMVVTREEPQRYLGIIRRREIFRLFLEQEISDRSE